MRWVACAAAVMALGGGSSVAWAENAAPVDLSRSQVVPLTAAGTLKVQGTWGEVDVEAWDRPEVEVVMTARSKGSVDAEDADEARMRLQRFTFEAAAQSPDRVEVTGISPKSSLLKPLGGKSGVNVRYAIRMPRTANLILDHNVGEVRIAGLTGNVDVANDMGSIRLAVPLDPDVAIETAAKVGDADIGTALRKRGTYKQRALVGHSFSYAPPAARRHVTARVGVGSVSID